MHKSALTLTLTAVLAASQVQAADWAHDDPDKASSGSVQIWDGSKSVTVNSAPTLAVATLASGTPIGGVVDSPLSLSDFLSVNDLNAANWRDVTFEPGKSSVNIQGTKLGAKLGKNSVKTIDKRVYEIKTYLGAGTFPYPAGSTHSFTGGSVPFSITVCNQVNGGKESNRNCYNVYGCKTFKKATIANNKITITAHEVEMKRYIEGRNSLRLESCGGAPSKLDIKIPNTSTSAIRQFMKVDDK